MSIEYTPQAEWDILEAVDSILDDLGAGVARAFRHRLEQTLTGLEAMPHTGSPVDPPSPNFPGLRFRPVHRFRGRVVYYYPTPTGIYVVRVLHAHQDTAGTFG